MWINNVKKNDKIILNIIKSIIIQSILAYITWIIFDIIGVFLTIYYLDINNTLPFLFHWKLGILDFTLYISIIFLDILILWGILFVFNSIIHLKTNLLLASILIIGNAIIYNSLIFNKIFNIYFFNETNRIIFYSGMFVIFLWIKKNLIGNKPISHKG